MSGRPNAPIQRDLKPENPVRIAVVHRAATPARETDLVKLLADLVDAKRRSAQR